MPQTIPINLSTQLPTEAIGDFFILPLPSSWKEAINGATEFLMPILETSYAYLGGGFLRSMIGNGLPSANETDIDLFFSSYIDYQTIKSYYSGQVEFEQIFQCPNDKLSTFREKSTKWNYQCIAVDFYPSLYNLVASFDFTTICLATDGHSLVYHKSASSDTVSRLLRWNKITYPASSMRRMMKYARKGFSMSEHEYQYFVDCVATHHSDIVDAQLVYVD